MKKTYVVGEWNNVKHVCNRDCLAYKIIERDESEITVEIELEDELIEEFEEDILCEKQRQGTGSKLPVYSYRTLINKEKRNRLMMFYGKRGYFVYKPDYEKVRKHCI